MAKLATPRYFGEKRPYCCYCRRELTAPEPERSTSLTRDHVHSQASGGMIWVPCCRKCNQLKGDLPIEQWRWFIGHHPRWWKTFDTNEQVRRVIREYIFAQAVAMREARQRRYGT